MSHTHAVSKDLLRIEEVDTALVLPQILTLRARVGGHLSLAPDMAPWLDPLDGRAMHWGVFRNAELVAAARLCVRARLDEMPDAALFQPLGDALPDLAQGPVALMSHCVVHPCGRDLQLQGALDAVRIERARQLGLGVLLAVARSPRRLLALAAQGFTALAPTADGRSAAVLRLRQEPAQIRQRVLSRR